jgi:hypothetical protein
MKTNSRIRTAVKRSVHFVLTESFTESIEGVSKNFTREFWRYLDDENSSTRKIIRKKAWNVWTEYGEDVLSANFTQGTMIVITKRGPEITMSLKEVAGPLTELSKIRNTESKLNELTENEKEFERIWNGLMKINGNYPSHYRPLTSPVAQMISLRTGAPLPVVCSAINKKIMPSDLSSGYVELAKKSMPDEVFDESIVNAAIRDGIAERVGDPKNFTFKVKRDKYREWVARIEANKWDVGEASEEIQIEEE